MAYWDQDENEDYSYSDDDQSLEFEDTSSGSGGFFDESGWGFSDDDDTASPSGFSSLYGSASQPKIINPRDVSPSVPDRRQSLVSQPIQQQSISAGLQPLQPQQQQQEQPWYSDAISELLSSAPSEKGGQPQADPYGIGALNQHTQAQARQPRTQQPEYAPLPRSTGEGSSDMFADLRAQGLWGDQYGAPVGKGNVQVQGGVRAGQPGYYGGGGTYTVGYPGSPGSTTSTPGREQGQTLTAMSGQYTPDKNGKLSLIGDVGRQSGLDDEGARVLQAIATTEGGLEGAVGDKAGGGSYGPFQFYAQGQLGGFAKWAGVSTEEAKQLANDPVKATQYAAQTYLGNAIRAGQAQGLTGAALATYAQRHGQVSVNPEKSGQNYNMLFANGQDPFKSQTRTMEFRPDRDIPPPSPKDYQGIPGARDMLDRGENPGIQLLPDRGGYTGNITTTTQTSLKGITPDQAALSDVDKWSLCGPVAAIAFARRNGRDPTIEEAKELGRQVGWTPAGMAGPSSQVALLKKLGVAASQAAPDPGKMAADIQRGNPVIIDTPGHYFVAEAYDPQTGRFDFGNSAKTLKASGGRTQYTLGELQSLGMGAARTAIHMDNPATPNPSVVAGASPGRTTTATTTGGYSGVSSNYAPGQFTQPTQAQSGPAIRADVGNRPVTLYDIALGQWNTPSTAGVAPPPVVKPERVVYEQPPAATPTTTTQSVPGPTQAQVPEWRRQRAQEAQRPATPPGGMVAADRQDRMDDFDPAEMEKERVAFSHYEGAMKEWEENVNKIDQENARRRAEYDTTVARTQMNQVLGAEAEVSMADPPEMLPIPGRPAPPTTPQHDRYVQRENARRKAADPNAEELQPIAAYDAWAARRQTQAENRPQQITQDIEAQAATGRQAVSGQIQAGRDTQAANRMLGLSTGQQAVEGARADARFMDPAGVGIGPVYVDPEKYNLEARQGEMPFSAVQQSGLYPTMTEESFNNLSEFQKDQVRRTINWEKQDQAIRERQDRVSVTDEEIQSQLGDAYRPGTPRGDVLINQTRDRLTTQRRDQEWEDVRTPDMGRSFSDQIVPVNGLIPAATGTDDPLQRQYNQEQYEQAITAANNQKEVQSQVSRNDWAVDERVLDATNRLIFGSSYNVVPQEIRDGIAHVQQRYSQAALDGVRGQIQAGLVGGGAELVGDALDIPTLERWGHNQYVKYTAAQLSSPRYAPDQTKFQWNDPSTYTVGLESAVESLPLMAAALATRGALGTATRLASLGRAAPAVIQGAQRIGSTGTMMAGMSGAAYEEARMAGADNPVLYGLVGGSVEAALESLPINVRIPGNSQAVDSVRRALTSNITNALGRVGANMTQEGLQEVAQEAWNIGLQATYEQQGDILNRLGQSFIAGAAMGAPGAFTSDPNFNNNRSGQVESLPSVNAFVRDAQQEGQAAQGAQVAPATATNAPENTLLGANVPQVIVPERMFNEEGDAAVNQDNLNRTNDPNRAVDWSRDVLNNIEVPASIVDGSALTVDKVTAAQRAIAQAEGITGGLNLDQRAAVIDLFDIGTNSTAVQMASVGGYHMAQRPAEAGLVAAATADALDPNTPTPNTVIGMQQAFQKVASAQPQAASAGDQNAPTQPQAAQPGNLGDGLDTSMLNGRTTMTEAQQNGRQNTPAGDAQATPAPQAATTGAAAQPAPQGAATPQSTGDSQMPRQPSVFRGISRTHERWYQDTDVNGHTVLSRNRPSAQAQEVRVPRTGNSGMHIVHNDGAIGGGGGSSPYDTPRTLIDRHVEQALGPDGLAEVKRVAAANRDGRIRKLPTKKEQKRASRETTYGDYFGALMNVGGADLVGSAAEAAGIHAVAYGGTSAGLSNDAESLIVFPQARQRLARIPKGQATLSQVDAGAVPEGQMRVWMNTSDGTANRAIRSQKEIAQGAPFVEVYADPSDYAGRSTELDKYMIPMLVNEADVRMENGRLRIETPSGKYTPIAIGNEVIDKSIKNANARKGVRRREFTMDEQVAIRNQDVDLDRIGAIPIGEGTDDFVNMYFQRGEVPMEQRQAIANRQYMRDLAARIGGVFDQSLQLMQERFGDINDTYFQGFSWTPGPLAYNTIQGLIRGNGERNNIYINFHQHINDANEWARRVGVSIGSDQWRRYLASDLVGTIIHEIAHSRENTDLGAHGAEHSASIRTMMSNPAIEDMIADIYQSLDPNAADQMNADLQTLADSVGARNGTAEQSRPADSGQPGTSRAGPGIPDGGDGRRERGSPDRVPGVSRGRERTQSPDAVRDGAGTVPGYADVGRSDGDDRGGTSAGRVAGVARPAFGYDEFAFGVTAAERASDVEIPRGGRGNRIPNAAANNVQLNINFGDQEEAVRRDLATIQSRRGDDGRIRQYPQPALDEEQQAKLDDWVDNNTAAAAGHKTFPEGHPRQGQKVKKQGWSLFWQNSLGRTVKANSAAEDRVFTYLENEVSKPPGEGAFKAWWSGKPDDGQQLRLPFIVELAKRYGGFEPDVWALDQNNNLTLIEIKSNGALDQEEKPLSPEGKVTSGWWVMKKYPTGGAWAAAEGVRFFSISSGSDIVRNPLNPNSREMLPTSAEQGTHPLQVDEVNRRLSGTQWDDLSNTGEGTKKAATIRAAVALEHAMNQANVDAVAGGENYEKYQAIEDMTERRLAIYRDLVRVRDRVLAEQPREAQQNIAEGRTRPGEATLILDPRLVPSDARVGNISDTWADGQELIDDIARDYELRVKNLHPNFIEGTNGSTTPTSFIMEVDGNLGAAEYLGARLLQRANVQDPDVDAFVFYDDNAADDHLLTLSVGGFGDTTVNTMVEAYTQQMQNAPEGRTAPRLVAAHDEHGNLTGITIINRNHAGGRLPRTSVERAGTVLANLLEGSGIPVEKQTDSPRKGRIVDLAFGDIDETIRRGEEHLGRRPLGGTDIRGGYTLAPRPAGLRTAGESARAGADTPLFGPFAPPAADYFTEADRLRGQFIPGERGGLGDGGPGYGVPDFGGIGGVGGTGRAAAGGGRRGRGRTRSAADATPTPAGVTENPILPEDMQAFRELVEANPRSPARIMRSLNGRPDVERQYTMAEVQAGIAALPTLPPAPMYPGFEDIDITDFVGAAATRSSRDRFGDDAADTYNIPTTIDDPRSQARIDADVNEKMQYIERNGVENPPTEAELRRGAEGREARWLERANQAAREASQVRDRLQQALPDAEVRVAGALGRGDFHTKGPRTFDYDMHISGLDLPASDGKLTVPLPDNVTRAIKAAQRGVTPQVDAFVTHEDKLWAVVGKNLSRKPGTFGKETFRTANGLTRQGRPMDWEDFEPSFRDSIEGGDVAAAPRTSRDRFGDADVVQTPVALNTLPNFGDIDVRPTRQDGGALPTPTDQNLSDIYDQASGGVARAASPPRTIPGFDEKKFSRDARQQLRNRARQIASHGPVTLDDAVRQGAHQMNMTEADFRRQIAPHLSPLEIVTIVKTLDDLRAQMFSRADAMNKAPAVTEHEFREFLQIGFRYAGMHAQLSGNPETIKKGSESYTIQRQNMAKGETPMDVLDRMVDYARIQGSFLHRSQIFNVRGAAKGTAPLVNPNPGRKQGKAFAQKFVTAVSDMNAMNVPSQTVAEAWQNLIKPRTTVGDWMIGNMYNAMLGLRTAVSAAFGNTLEIGWRGLRDTLVTYGSNNPLMASQIMGMEAWGYMSGVVRAAQAFGQVLLHGATREQLRNNDVAVGRLTNNDLGIFSTPANIVGHGMEMFFGRFFSGVDAFTRTLSYSMHLGRLAALEAKARDRASGTKNWTLNWNLAMSLMENPTEKMTADATRVGLETALQGQMGSMGEVMARVQNFPVIGRVAFPFLRTIYHDQSRRIDRSPIGIIATLFDVVSTAPGDGWVEKGKNWRNSTYLKDYTTKQAARPAGERIIDGVMGTVATAMLYWAVKEGLVMVTGEPPEDPEERRMWTREGKQMYAVGIKAWNSMVPYGNLGPASGALAAIAAINDAENRGETPPLETWGRASWSMARSMTELSYFSNVASIFTALTEQAPKGKTEWLGYEAKRFITGQVTGRMPFGATTSMIGQYEDEYNRYPRATDLTGNILESIAGRMPYNPPVEVSLFGQELDRGALLPALDAWGFPQENPYRGWRVAFPRSTSHMNDPVDLEIRRLQKEDGVDQLPKKPPTSYKKFDFKAAGDPQRYEWERRVGQNSYFILQEMFNTDAYKNAPAAEKDELVKNAYTRAKDEAFTSLGIVVPVEKPDRGPKYYGLEGHAAREGTSWWQLEKEIDDAISAERKWNKAMDDGKTAERLSPRVLQLAGIYGDGSMKNEATQEQTKAQQEAKKLKKENTPTTNIPFRAAP